MKWTDNEPVYGDMIRVKVKFYYHYGIFVNENSVIQFGLPDNTGVPTDEICVIETDIDTFSGGDFIEKAELTDSDEKRKCRKPEEIVSIARASLGQNGYNILHNNCEHFVYSCVFGEKRSFLDEAREAIRKKLNKG